MSSAPYWNNSEFIELGHGEGPAPFLPRLPLPLNWSTLTLLLHWSYASWSHSGIHEPQPHSEAVVTCGELA